MDIFKKMERYIAIALLVLMVIVLIAGVVEVAYEVGTDFVQPPRYFLDVNDLIDTFGLFLMVLIGLELMATMQMYLTDHAIHAEMMLLVALTAVTRKVVIMDALTVEPLLVFGVGFLILTLSAGFFLIRKNYR